MLPSHTFITLLLSGGKEKYISPIRYLDGALDKVLTHASLA